MGSKMCGILGILGHTPMCPEQTFKAALSTLSHRGPDASCVWEGKNALLGHTRLAIIDLSKSGNQPFHDPESGLWIVFNGEIYNYVELRKELELLGHRFRTHTDTEVLLKGYTEWGEKVLTRCNGMWAFLVWDPKRQQAFFSRDRFGVKPFYFANKHNSFLFASEPKALHALDGSLKQIDPDTIVDLVTCSKVHAGAQTFYKHIDSLPAAHCGRFDFIEQKLSIWRYWDYPESHGTGQVTSEYEEFFELFSDAVRIRHRSDVDVGLTLSGGLDSSAILSASTHVDSGNLKCFTSTYSGAEGGELEWAQKAASLASANLYRVESSLETWWDTLKRVVYHMDGPGFSPAVIPLWSIMEQARKNDVPVLLEGQGADELLAGYAWHSAVNVLSDLQPSRIGRLRTDASEMLQAHGLKWAAAWFARTAFSDTYKRIAKKRRHKLFHDEIIDGWHARQANTGLPEHKSSYDSLKSRLMADHSTDLLPSLLHYGDAVSMAHGIESRLPFMDYRLVEWVFRNPVDLMKDGKAKSPVRSYLHANNFGVIAERKDKVGYHTPVKKWLGEHCSSQIQELIENKSAPIWDVMSLAEVRKLVGRFDSGYIKESEQLYKIVTTSMWLDDLKERSTGVVAKQSLQQPAAAC